MLKRLAFVFSLLCLGALGFCGYNYFRNVKPTPTILSTPTGMERYEGAGMSIMLPPSYETRDVRADLPTVIDIILRFTGGDDGVLGGLLDNVEQNVVWWGQDTGTLDEAPLRLLVIKSKALNYLPITLTSFGLEHLLNNDETTLEQTTLKLGERSVVRFKYIKEEVAWVAYAFKEQGHLWLSLFMFTPEGLVGAQHHFEESMGTIVINPIESNGN